MIFDYNSDEYIYQTSCNKAYDSNGDNYRKMGSSMAMNMDTGELHFISGWNDNDKDDWYNNKRNNWYNDDEDDW